MILILNRKGGKKEIGNKRKKNTVPRLGLGYHFGPPSLYNRAAQNHQQTAARTPSATLTCGTHWPVSLPRARRIRFTATRARVSTTG
jgi:hypothetical protein